MTNMYLTPMPDFKYNPTTPVPQIEMTNLEPQEPHIIADLDHLPHQSLEDDYNEYLGDDYPRWSFLGHKTTTQIPELSPRPPLSLLLSEFDQFSEPTQVQV